MAPRAPIYLDHHATTPTDARVVEAMLPYFAQEFGNAASHTHAYGWRAEAAVELARESLARGRPARDRLHERRYREQQPGAARCGRGAARPPQPPRRARHRALLGARPAARARAPRLRAHRGSG